MGREGPLGHAELSAIDELLDAGELDDAKHRLARLPQSAAFDAGASYLATRLLYLRGRLDADGVAQRLQDLLAVTTDFPEAQRMLEEAEHDALPPSLRVPGPSEPPAEPSRQESAPALELGFSSTPVEGLDDEPGIAVVAAPEPASDRSRLTRGSSIPRAPGLPQFSEPVDPNPSYAPALPEREAESARISDVPPPSEEARISDLSPPAPDVDPDRSGRYSENPPAPDQVELPAHAARYAPRSEPPRSAAPRPVRSGAAPPPELGALPSLFELASLLDQGEYRRIVNAIDSAPDAGPGYVLMRARALASEGHRAEAAATLERLAHAPLLDPELRAGSARVLLELGDPSARDQARRAYEDDPEPPLVRLTLAWALLRGACRKSDARGIEEATELLSDLRARSGPHPGLVTALRALLQALAGDAERAVSAAQRALALDPKATDALAAIALASARLGREHDAQQAWLRLLQLSYEQADALSDELEAHGVSLSHLDPSLPPGEGGEGIFEAIERMPGEGNREQAVAAFEQLARACLTELAERGTEHAFSIIAPVAASFLSTSPIARDFSPYDLSLWSVARVDALVEVLYGKRPRPRRSDDFPVILLVGSYVGEAIRGASGARWRGSVARINEACVEGDRTWSPFEMVRARIERGEPLATGIAPDTEAWSHRIDNPVSPPCPWDPLPWPAADTLEVLGRALQSSAIGAYAVERGGAPLDLTLPSLAVLDRYVDLVAPLREKPTAEAPWARRTAVLLGAYVGEVLRATLGGGWHQTDQAGASAYAIQLGGSRILPVVGALDRLERRSLVQLSGYARTVVASL